MRIALVSDLHLEYDRPPDIDASAFDVLVAAGDIGQGMRGIEWLISLDVDAVYVMGNHEYWDEPDMEAHLARVKARARGTRVHVLERDRVIIGNTRFLGATLWVDYGGRADWMRASYFGMNDFRRIGAVSTHARWAADPKLADRLARTARRAKLQTPPGVGPDRVHPAFLLDRHRRSRKWLERELAKPFAGSTVVVSHHAPTQDSLVAWGFDKAVLAPDYDGGQLRSSMRTRIASYASANLDPVLARYRHRIDAWCHGHTHQQASLSVHTIPVYCNAASDSPLTFDPVRDSRYAPLAQEGEELHDELRGIADEFSRHAERLVAALDEGDTLAACAFAEAAETRAARFDSMLQQHVALAEEALEASRWGPSHGAFSRIGRPFSPIMAQGYLSRAISQMLRDDEFDLDPRWLARRARQQMTRGLRQLRMLSHAVHHQNRALRRALDLAGRLAEEEGVRFDVEWPARLHTLQQALPVIRAEASHRDQVERILEAALHPKGPPRDLLLSVDTQEVE